jgi:hypothetical protein
MFDAGQMVLVVSQQPKSPHLIIQNPTFWAVRLFVTTVSGHSGRRALLKEAFEHVAVLIAMSILLDAMCRNT